ncbi:MAG: hypothetical protein CL570_04345 [Alphaproteobacteria bacterium]|nr:hypothetical protein [Alphaproteobacteria bacterium]|tara:strand:+ start:2923 stop:3258 length:336 start_codon:yes stop_codon:yes gene_type:complete
MPFEKGESGNPNGRPKGSTNRSTKAMKKALAQLIDDNLDNMSDWLNEMAKDDPKAAFQCMLSLMEFHMPKMSRVTFVGDNEEKADHEINKHSQAIADAVDREMQKVLQNPI